MISGEENMGVASLKDLTPTCDYDEEKDVIFFKGKCELELVKENEFIIFYPEDAHLPCQINNSSQKVKKTVIKILI